MDWYSYYMQRFGWGHNPYQSTGQCQRIVMELLNSHIVPMRVAAESAVAYLCALYDSAGEGYTVSFPFRLVMNALTNTLHRAYDSVESMDVAWAREMQDAEREDGDGPPYEPGNYEVADEDIADEEPVDWEDYNSPAAAIAELYSNGGEPSISSIRRNFPDWEHISDWTQSDWIQLQTYKDKILAAAEHGFMAIGSVSGALSAAKEAMNRIPLPRQVELGMWAQEVVDCLMVGMEDDLQRMCAGSLHSHAGRLVQKQLLVDTTGHHENTQI